MVNPSKLYHCTRFENLKRILNEGLLVKTPFQRKKKEEGVYLSKYPFNWMWNSTCFGRIKGIILEINVKGLSLKQDSHEDWRDLNIDSEGDFICLEDISPKRIIKVLVEKEKNTFEELKNMI